MAGPRLDHLALASRSAWDNLITYAYHLGGRWTGGSDNYDDPDANAFYFAQVDFANGTTIEMLEPLPVPGSDFLDRFIHRNGPGPHHFTFKFDSLDEAIDAVASLGYGVVNESRSDPGWQEAFLHPKQSHGIVVQIASQGDSFERGPMPEPLPPSPQAGSIIEKVVHLVADLDAARALFEGPLGMEPVEEIAHRFWRGVALTNGPWTVELVEPLPDAPAAQWLGNRTGRLLQVCLAVPDPGSVPGSVRLGGGIFQLHPETNQGTRVLLRRLDSR